MYFVLTLVVLEWAANKLIWVCWSRVHILLTMQFIPVVTILVLKDLTL